MRDDARTSPSRGLFDRRPDGGYLATSLAAVGGLVVFAIVGFIAIWAHRRFSCAGLNSLDVTSCTVLGIFEGWIRIAIAIGSGLLGLIAVPYVALRVMRKPAAGLTSVMMIVALMAAGVVEELVRLAPDLGPVNSVGEASGLLLLAVPVIGRHAALLITERRSS